MESKAPKKNPKDKRSGTGPGKKIITLYVDKEMHAKMVKRATDLDMTLAKYVQALGRRDLIEEGEFSITPLSVPQVSRDQR